MDKKKPPFVLCVSCVCVCDINVFKCKPRDYSVFPWACCIGAFSHTPHISVLEYWWLQRTEFFVVKRQTLLNVGLKDEAILWKWYFLGHFPLIYQVFWRSFKINLFVFLFYILRFTPTKNIHNLFSEPKNLDGICLKKLLLMMNDHGKYLSLQYNYTRAIWSYKYMYRE